VGILRAVRRLTLLDTPDYEWLISQVAEGFSMTAILTRKT
jgi:hypothetical protein